MILLYGCSFWLRSSVSGWSCTLHIPSPCGTLSNVIRIPFPLLFLMHRHEWFLFSSIHFFFVNSYLFFCVCFYHFHCPIVVGHCCTSVSTNVSAWMEPLLHLESNWPYLVCNLNPLSDHTMLTSIDSIAWSALRWWWWYCGQKEPKFAKQFSFIQPMILYCFDDVPQKSNNSEFIICIFFITFCLYCTCDGNFSTPGFRMSSN